MPRKSELNKMIMKTLAFLLPLCLVFESSFGQDLDDLDDYRVENFYQKVDLEYGTLDQDGNMIEFFYEKND